MIWNFFKKGQDEPPPEPDEPEALVLARMQPGCRVDFDLKTYRVAGRHHYIWNDGGRTEEWELRNGGEVLLLEHVEDEGEPLWMVSRKIPLSGIQGDVAGHIARHGDPPEKIAYLGGTYTLEEDDVGRFYRDGIGPPRNFVTWDFTNSAQDKILTIEQWGETEFAAALGFEVEEYQFSNIQPGRPGM